MTTRVICDECDFCIDPQHDGVANAHCDRCDEVPVITTREEWVEYGISKGYCSPTYCDTHDGTPMVELELDQFDSGHDPCVIAIRLGNEDEWQADAEAFGDIK